MAKKNLQEKFTYTPGKTLPDSALPSKELLQIQKSGEGKRPARREVLTSQQELAKMFQAVTLEIDERKEYARQIEELDARDPVLKDVQREIQERIYDLKRIDAMLRKGSEN
jgi:hypothetical protein